LEPIYADFVRQLELIRHQAGEARARSDAAIAELRRLAGGGTAAGVPPELLRTLLDATEAAWRASEAKSRVLADISHDLKQPLLVLQMSFEMLARHLPEGAGRRERARIERTFEKLQEALEMLARAARRDLADLAAAPRGTRPKERH
jgi:signal transduction histidine kinase